MTQFDDSFWTNWFNGNLPDAIPIPQVGFWAQTTRLWQEQGHLAPGEDPCLKVNLQPQLVQHPQCPLFLASLKRGPSHHERLEHGDNW